ncbi:MAG: tRNA pseudouridine(13) synthase TruD [Phycisphaerales bacterium]|nr:tRNA pseudouridine(13) synthase TruD [Phycisphaerales bacterium]
MSSEPSGSSPPPHDTDPRVRPAVYLSDDIPGIGGEIKRRPEDFLVEEIPAYQPTGEGEHIFMFIEKRSLSTLELVAILAEHFGVAKTAVGVAGLKDKHAITRQVVSVHTPGKKVSDFPMLTDERIGVLWADQHTNKLRRGHLTGNRFSIRVRGVSPTKVREAYAVLNKLERLGVPNRLGEQRFGYMGNNHLIGRAIVLGEHKAALDLMLGPGELEDSRQEASRRAYTEGDYGRALSKMPRHLASECAALRVLSRGGTPQRAVKAIGRTVTEFYLTAMQSAVFNAVLDERLLAGTLAELGEGDIAFKHDNGACFSVDSETAADPETSRRAGSLEISPSGPMWGPKMMRASGETDRAEVAALERFGLSVEAVTEPVEKIRTSFEGVRRPLRVPVRDTDVEGGVDEVGNFVRVAFTLPRGAFATVVMREIMKPELTGSPMTDPAEDKDR